MKLTLSFARLLQQLKEGQQVNYGSFQGRNRSVLDQFVKDGVFDLEMIGTQQKKVICRDAVNFDSYLHHKFEIPDLVTYIAFLEKEDTERSDAVKATSNSKYRSTKVFAGFLINAYEEIHCTLNGEPFVVQPRQGAFTFIYDCENFQIPLDFTVVGVEGHENFREIERQHSLFDGIKPLFVWRYLNSNAIADWLKNIPNPYLHFGDFDPKGLHIYVTEFRNKISVDRCRFLLPGDLDKLMFKYGEKSLFEKQQNFLYLVKVDLYPELREVIQIIERHRKGLAQEVLIEN
jgi:hypothetical protein